MGAVLLISVGTLLSGFSGGDSLVDVASGLMSGCGMAWLVTSWGWLYTTIDVEQTELAILGSASILVACAFIFPSLTGFVGIVGVALLPVASGICFFLASKGRNHPQTNLPDPAPPSPTLRAVIQNLSFVVALFLLCAVVGILSSSLPASQGTDLTLGFDLPVLIGNILGTALAICLVLFTVKIDALPIIWWVTPLLVLGVVLLPWHTAIGFACISCLVSTVDTCIQSVVFLFFVLRSRDMGLTPVAGICLGQATMQLGITAGGLFSTLTLANISAQSPESFGWSLAICLILCVATSFASAAWYHGATHQPSNGASLPNQTVSDAQNTLCQIVDTYGISPREAEVLHLLAQGRSQPYIRDALSMSKSTVATHVRHIYQKMGVHTRQELLDTIESRRNRII